MAVEHHPIPGSSGTGAYRLRGTGTGGIKPDIIERLTLTLKRDRWKSWQVMRQDGTTLEGVVDQFDPSADQNGGFEFRLVLFGTDGELHLLTSQELTSVGIEIGSSPALVQRYREASALASDAVIHAKSLSQALKRKSTA